MNLEQDWSDIRAVFVAARRRGLHHALATVNDDGTPQVTPIGSLWLHGDRPRAIYFDMFNRRLASNLNARQRVMVMAVDPRYSLWIAAFVRGHFTRHLAIRLAGTVSPRRRPQDEETRRIERLFRRTRFTRGSRLLRSRIEWIRDIDFDAVAPVRVGRMTSALLG